jgi:hypothetical protein
VDDRLDHAGEPMIHDQRLRNQDLCLRRYCLRMSAAPTPAIAALIRAKVDHTVHPYHHDPGTTAFGDEVSPPWGGIRSGSSRLWWPPSTAR